MNFYCNLVNDKWVVVCIYYWICYHNLKFLNTRNLLDAYFFLLYPFFLKNFNHFVKFSKIYFIFWKIIFITNNNSYKFNNWRLWLKYLTLIWYRILYNNTGHNFYHFKWFLIIIKTIYNDKWVNQNLHIYLYLSLICV